MVALGTQSLGLVGIPVGLIVGKSLGVVYLAYSANKYLDRLPVREVLMVTLSTLPMALVVSAFASQPLLAIALGILIYGFCQMVYYTADPQHPLKS